MSIFKLQRADLDQKWDDFAVQSQFTIFSCADYLKNTGLRLGCYYCLKVRD